MDQPVSAPKTNPKSSPQTILLLVLTSILMAVLIFEGALYMAPGLMPNLITAYFQDENLQPWTLLVGDEELGFKYPPDLVNFSTPFHNDQGGQSFYPVSTVSLGYNDIGFRDDGITGQSYAVVVGDSFAACAAVKMEECWVELLEQKQGRDYANLGVLSYGPQQTQAMLSRYGLPLHPQVVLWAFYVNDPYDAWRFNEFGVPGVVTGKFWASPLRRWLAQHSSTYLVLAYFWYNRYLFSTLINTNAETFFSRYELAWWQIATDPSAPAIAEGIELTNAAILEARQQTVSRLDNAQFVVVIFPTREQVYASGTPFQIQLDALTNNLVEFCRQNDIAVIDLTPALRERVINEPFIYFKRDLHLNARGNQIVTELLDQHLMAIQPR